MIILISDFFFWFISQIGGIMAQCNQASTVLLETTKSSINYCIAREKKALWWSNKQHISRNRCCHTLYHCISLHSGVNWDKYLGLDYLVQPSPLQSVHRYCANSPTILNNIPLYYGVLNKIHDYMVFSRSLKNNAGGFKIRQSYTGQCYNGIKKAACWHWWPDLGDVRNDKQLWKQQQVESKILSWK